MGELLGEGGLEEAWSTEWGEQGCWVLLLTMVVELGIEVLLEGGLETMEREDTGWLVST